MHYNLDERALAAQSFEKAAPLLHAAKDLNGEADALLNLGAVYQDMGNPSKAIEYFNQTLPFFRESKDKYGQAVTIRGALGGRFDGSEDLGYVQPSPGARPRLRRKCRP